FYIVYELSWEQQMKIVIFANSSFNVVNYRKKLIQELMERKHEVHLIVPRDQNFSKLRSHFTNQIHSIPLSPKGINPIWEIFSFFHILKTIKSIAPDIIINFTIKCTIYGSLAAHIARVQSIYSVITGLGSVFSKYSTYSIFLKIFIKPFYRMALTKNRKVFFQNKDDQRLFEKLSMVDLKQCEIVAGSGVDTAFFSRISKKNRIPNSFIMVSRIIWEKGVREYIQAAMKIKNEYPDAVFSLMGPLESDSLELPRNELSKWIDSSAINYIPSSSKVKEQLDVHKFFIFPSFYREGIPRAILEAMSMEMPIITTDNPGCRETVVNGANGFLIPVQNAQKLESKMRELLNSSPDLIRQFGKMSRRICKEKFDVRKVNSQMINGMGL
ncbi:MAG: glycosyltransferase family 4 protein, partial [Halobacteriovoraceae bacterium]|nr:glycosyltransferase family 4 protein [Halobacteriovoraceae bacterium]